MKKYIKPVSKVVEVNSEELLAGSPGTHDEVSGYSETFSKQNNFWEDED